MESLVFTFADWACLDTSTWDHSKMEEDKSMGMVKGSHHSTRVIAFANCLLFDYLRKLNYHLHLHHLLDRFVAMLVAMFIVIVTVKMVKAKRKIVIHQERRFNCFFIPPL